MKILIGLSVLQTIAIIVLLAFAANDPARVPHEQDASAHAKSNALYREVSASVDGNSSPSIEEQRLRIIIREELAARQTMAEASGAPTQSDSTKPDNGVDARTAAHLLEQRDRVAQTIELYKGVGSITDQQMQVLQDEIAQLDEQGRKQTMSLLIRALNAGTLKGRLQ